MEQLYKCIFWNLYVKKIIILKVISNYYDLTQKNSSFNIQPVVKLFGEEIKFDREKYAFKDCEGLETSISNNNPTTKELKEYDSKIKEIIKNSNSLQILDSDDNKDNLATPLHA